MLFVDLTGVDKSSRCPFAELFGFVGQRDLHDPGDVTRGGLDPDGMRGDQLEEETHRHRYNLGQNTVTAAESRLNRMFTYCSEAGSVVTFLFDFRGVFHCGYLMVTCLGH